MRQWEGAFLEGYWSEENGNEGLFDEHGLITINGLRRNIDRGEKKPQVTKNITTGGNVTQKYTSFTFLV